MSRQLSARSAEIMTDVKRMMIYLCLPAVKDLRFRSPDRFRDDVSTRYARLEAASKAVFRMLLELEDPSTFEVRRLHDMLLRKDLIDRGVSTVNTESVVIGQQYYDEFVKPLVGDDGGSAPK